MDSGCARTSTYILILQQTPIRSRHRASLLQLIYLLIMENTPRENDTPMSESGTDSGSIRDTLAQILHELEGLRIRMATQEHLANQYPIRAPPHPTEGVTLDQQTSSTEDQQRNGGTTIAPNDPFAVTTQLQNKRKPLPMGDTYDGDRNTFAAWRLTIAHKLDTDREFIGSAKDQFVFIWQNLSAPIQSHCTAY